MGELFDNIGLPGLDPAFDCAMICGSEAILTDTCIVLEEFGLKMSPRIGEAGDYVIEKAFAEK